MGCIRSLAHGQHFCHLALREQIRNRIRITKSQGQFLDCCVVSLQFNLKSSAELLGFTTPNKTDPAYDVVTVLLVKYYRELFRRHDSRVRIQSS